MDDVLRLDSVRIGYGRREVVHGIGLAVARGSIVAMVGRNGAGKSTVLRGVIGALPVRSGRVDVNGTDVTTASPRQRISLGLGYVSQSRSCFAPLSVLENLMVASHTAASRKERHRSVARSVERFPQLQPLLDSPCSSLSGGQQQQLAIAMGMINEPVCLLLDEPSLGLGHGVLSDVQRLLTGFAEKGGAVLLVEQKPQVAFAISQQLHLLENGIVTMRGPTPRLAVDPEFIDRYLGLAHEGESNRVCQNRQA